MDLKVSDESDKNSCSINILPTDCLIKICSYLTCFDRLNFENVCQKWQDTSPFIWSNITKLNAGEHQQNVIEMLIIKCGRFLKELILESSCDYSIIPIVSQHCINLVNFDFCLRPNFEKMYFNNSFNNMNKLKSLTIRDDSDDFHDDVGYILQSIHNEIEEISFLSINNERKYLSDDFANEFEKFTTICKIFISNCLISEDVISMINKKKTLTELTFLNCTFSICLFQWNLPNLQSLCLNYCWYINDCLLESITINCKKLKNFKLCLTSNHLISKEAILQIGQLKNLEELRLDFMSSQVDDDLMKILYNIKFLDCADCYKVTDIGIISILKNCKNIQRLHIVGTSVTTSCLHSAVDIIKKREQEHRLIINVDQKIFDEFNNSINDIIIPQLLSIKSFPPKNY